MEERIKGPVLVQRSWSVPLVLIAVLAVVAFFVFALLPPGSLPPLTGELIPGGDNVGEVTETIVCSSDSAPSATVTTSPRVLSREGYNRLMFDTGFGYILLITGWYRYDGIELLDDFPCLQDCPVGVYFEAEEVIWDAFEQNNDEDFWGEWVCQGVDNGFGYFILSKEAEFNSYKLAFGNVDEEPYFPQFTGNYNDFACNVSRPEPTPIPSDSLGWPENVRVNIENKYLYPIISDGWDMFPGLDWPKNWTHVDVEALSDRMVCYAVANGHYHHGFEAYMPSNIERGYSQLHGLRMELRDKLNSELGVSVDGNPPLCPGFKGMIELANLP